MKRYSVPLGLFLLAALIVLFGWGSYYLLEKTAEKLLPPVKGIKSSIETESWEEASAYCEKTMAVWKEINRYWPMLTHHEEMDRIEESINKLTSYLAYKNAPLAMAEVNNLVYFIKHIPSKEALNLKNLL